MTGAFFPAGSRIGEFSVETFFSQENGVVTYLVRNDRREKFLLSVPDEFFSEETLRDIRLRDEVDHSCIVRTECVQNSPVPFIASPCVAGLSIDDHKFAGNTFSSEEALDIIRQLHSAVTAMLDAGCRNAAVNTQNVIIDSSNCVHLLRFNGRTALSNTDLLKKVMLEICSMTPAAAPELKKLQKKLETLPSDCSIEELALPAALPADTAADNRRCHSKIRLAVTGSAAVLLLAAAGIAGTLFLRKEPVSADTVTVTRISAVHRSSGPEIHEMESSPEEQKVAKVLNVPAVKKAKKVPRKPRRKTPVAPVIKKAGAPAVKKAEVPAVIAAAAKRGNLMELRNLLSSGNDVNLSDSEGRTALYYAAAANWKAMIDLLVKAGAEITPEAAAAGNAETAGYLQQLKNPLPVKPPPPRRKTAPRSPFAGRIVPRTANWRKAPRKDWHITLESALISAIRQKKKLFVLFTGADWCGPCKALKKNVLDSSEFRRLSKKFEVVYINMPRVTDRKFNAVQRNYNQRLSKELRAQGAVPCAIIMDRSGRQIDRITGFRNKADYLKKLEHILKR